MINASSYGFSSDNNGEENRRILQDLLDVEREVCIDTAGVYDICGSLYMPDGSHLHGVEGAVLRRQHNPTGKDSHFIMNSGAAKGVWNKQIIISNIQVSVNNVECTRASYNGVVVNSGEELFGGRGQIMFMYVKDLVIENFTLLDCAPKDYAIEITDFDNVRVEHVHIEGEKDAIHFGPGRNFVLRDGIFRTYDDPIAINATDYSPSGPNIGPIEHGLIENCIDLEQNHTCGYFVRFLVGSWKDWEYGMPVRHSEAVIHDGKFYRAVLPDDWTERVSLTPPTHDEGCAVLDDIAWCRTHMGYRSEELPRLAYIRDITLRNLTMQKKRTVGIIMYLSENEDQVGYRPGAPVPYVEDVTFDGIKVDCDIDDFMQICVPCRRITLKNSDLRGSVIRFEPASCGLDNYPASFTLENVTNMHLEDKGAFRPGHRDESIKVKY